MPKLILFAACEKVIVDEIDKTTSLINLLEAVQVGVPESEKPKVTPDTVIQVNWSILALWQAVPGDEGKKFQTHFVLQFKEDTKMDLPLPNSFAFEDGKPNYRNILRIMGLPLVHFMDVKTCYARAFIREEGMEEWGQPIGEFPILIRPVKVQ